MSDTIPELLTRIQVAKLMGLSPASVDRYRRQGRFPKPITLGPNRVAWVRAEVLDFIAARISERDGKAA